METGTHRDHDSYFDVQQMVSYSCKDKWIYSSAIDIHLQMTLSFSPGESHCGNK